MRRTTIKDIAKAAGVSPGAVSFALNDRPGVSDETRARIKQIADDLGWTRDGRPGGTNQKVRAVGLVLRHHTNEDYAESFVLRLVGGLEAVLKEQDQVLVLRLVTDLAGELDTYRAWADQGRVDGVVVLRPTLDDPRPALLRTLSMPAVAIGGIGDGVHIVSVDPDDAGKSRLLVDHLVAMGHRHITYLTGDGERFDIRARSAAFMGAGWLSGVKAEVVNLPAADERAGQRAMQDLLAQGAPTALLCDNELLVLGAMAAIHDAGLSAGRDIAIACYEDSPACRMLRPAITAIKRDPATLGRHAGASLLALVDGMEAPPYMGPTPSLVVRESTRHEVTSTPSGAASPAGRS